MSGGGHGDSDYTKMDHKALRKAIAEAHHSKAGDLGALTDALLGIHREIKSERVQNAMLQEFQTGVDDGQLSKEYKAVEKSYNENGGESLDVFKTKKHLAGMLKIILPTLGYASKDADDDMLLGQLMSYANSTGKKGQELYHSARKAISDGRGRDAANAILELMKMYKMSTYITHVNEETFANDDVTDALMGRIKKEYDNSKQLSGKLNLGLLKQDKDNALHHYVTGALDQLKAYKHKKAHDEHGAQGGHDAPAGGGHGGN